jgi:hypothetical protein
MGSLREFLNVEPFWRKKLGERPDLSGYVDRLPDSDVCVEVARAFKHSDPAHGPRDADTGARHEPIRPLQATTGKPASDFDVNLADLASAWNAGQLVALCSNQTQPKSSNIADSRRYAVVGYDPSSSQPFELYSPWGQPVRVRPHRLWNVLDQLR